MDDLNGKRVVVTGASRGIGRHLALDFASRGAQVCVNYQTSKADADAVVEEIAEAGGEAFAAAADVGQRSEVHAMFAEVAARWKGIDILVNNAGINRDSAFDDMTDADWDDVLSTNLKGPFLCSQAAVRLMRGEGSGGRIVNISAVTSLAGREGACNYSASKAGLNALTRCLAVELGPDIAVNAIALGFFESPLVHEVFSREQIAAVENSLPIGRMGRFEEVAGLVRYLCSDAAAFLTGEVISLDGGQFIRMS